MQQEQTISESSERKCLEAIARRLLIRADYNGMQYTLAPHQLLERHGELYLGAFNPGKAWRSEEERRLGYFKLKGLTNLELTEEPFEPLEGAAAILPREDDKLVFSV